MTQQIINVGTLPNDGTGDTLLSAMNKINTNFTDLYSTSYSANVVNSFNSRNGAVNLLTADVTSALTYTPLNKAGDTTSGLIVLGQGFVSNNTGSINVNAASLASLPAAATGTVLRAINLDTKSTLLTIDSYVNAGNPSSSLVLRGARGTGAAPTAIQNTDIIGSVGGSGFGASIYQTSSPGQINFVAEGNFTNSSTPTAISFQVTPTGSNVSAEVLRLTNAGNLNLTGNYTTSNSNPSVNLNDTSGTGQTNINFQSAGVVQWGWGNPSSSGLFQLSRYVGGVYSNSPIAVSNSSGLVTIANGFTSNAFSQVTTSGTTNTLQVQDTGGNGANLKLVGNGATTPSKFLRVQGGSFGIVNNAYTTQILTLTDAGNLSTSGGMDGTVIGANTPQNGTFTGLTANATATISSTSPLMVFNATSGTTLGTINFNAASSTAWQVQPTSTNFAIARYNAGSFVDSPLLISNSTGNVTFTDAIVPNTTKGIVGTVAADSAVAGSIGEFQTASSQTVAVSSTVTFNATSISLPAGDWDVWGVMTTNPAGSTTTSQYQCGISTSTGAFGTLATGVNNTNVVAGVAIAAGGGVTIVSPVTRINISSTTVVYVVGNISFASSTLTASTAIFARRRR